MIKARLENARNAILTIAGEASRDTQVPVASIIQNAMPANSKTTWNPFNVYKKMYKHLHPTESWNVENVRAEYDNFIATHEDTWHDILASFHSLSLHDSGETTEGARKKIFRSLDAKIKALVSLSLSFQILNSHSYNNR